MTIRRMQCFMCGYIENREDDDGNEQRKKEDDAKRDDILSEMAKEKKEISGGKDNGEIRCPKCGESKWIPLSTEQEIKVVKNQTRMLDFWNKVTDVISIFVIALVVFWRKTDLGRAIIFSRILSFIGISLGIFLISYWFNTGYNRAIVYMLILYGLFKWR